MVPDAHVSQASEDQLRNGWTYPFILDGITTLVSVSVGLLLALRTKGRLSYLSLGFAFITFCLYPSLPSRNSMGDSGLLATVLVQGYLAPLGLAAFAYFYYKENRAQPALWVKPWLWAYVAIMFLPVVVQSVEIARIWPSIYVIDLNIVILFFQHLSYIIVALSLYLGWHKSLPEQRKRFILAGLGLFLVMVADLIFMTTNLMNVRYVFSDNLALFGQAFTFSGHLLVAFALLRHRVIDPGFAINRTLVYALVSFILLAGFGLLEWGVDKVLPLEAREKNPLIDAGLALIIFLTFHRVRDFVEHRTEALFFHAWQQKEKALHQFVKEAAFVSKPEALQNSLITALNRFSGGEVALYIQHENEDFQRVAGQVAQLDSQIDKDSPPLLKARAEGGVVDLGLMRGLDDDKWGGGLLLPALSRSDLGAFVIMGLKPGGERYRPDEVELLGQVMRQVGLDLEALRVRELERLSAHWQVRYTEVKNLLATAKT